MVLRGVGVFIVAGGVCLSVSLPSSLSLPVSLRFGTDTLFIKGRNEVDFFPKVPFLRKENKRPSSLKLPPRLFPSNDWKGKISVYI